MGESVDSSGDKQGLQKIKDFLVKGHRVMNYDDP